MVKDHSDSERGKLLPPYRLLFPISSMSSFICIIPDRIIHTRRGALAGMKVDAGYTNIKHTSNNLIEIVYLMTHSTHFIYGYMSSDIG